MAPGNAFQRDAFQRDAFQIVYDFAPIIDGGLVLGGNVLASFHPGVVPPPPVRRRGTAGRVWRNILVRPRHYSSKVSGGLILGGAIRTYFHVTPIEEPIFVGVSHLAKVSGGIVLGGKVETQFISLPLIYISQPRPPISPTPEPVSYKAVSTLSGTSKLGGGVRTRFYSVPPPPALPRLFSFFNRHKAQQFEEDELLLMEIL